MGTSVLGARGKGDPPGRHIEGLSETTTAVINRSSRSGYRPLISAYGTYQPFAKSHIIVKSWLLIQSMPILSLPFAGKTTSIECKES